MSTDAFESQRPRLFGIAYRMLGSVADAEDAVQDAWIAWQRAPQADIAEPPAYLTTVVTRRCLDLLRSARARRERYPGPWLPEPLLPSTPDAAEGAEVAESVRMAFLVVLEALSPAQRAAFLLHDVFGYRYGELAAILDRSEAACRQLVARARADLRERRPRFDSDPATVGVVAERFLAACQTGDVDALLATLHPDSTLMSDGGGKVAAARRVLEGADRVARFLAGIASRYPAAQVMPTAVNGAPGAVVTSGGDVLAVASVDIEDGAVRRIHLVRNPDKLRHIDGLAVRPGAAEAHASPGTGHTGIDSAVGR